MSKTNNINSETHNLQKFDDYETLFLEKKMEKHEICINFEKFVLGS